MGAHLHLNRGNYNKPKAHFLMQLKLCKNLDQHPPFGFLKFIQFLHYPRVGCLGFVDEVNGEFLLQLLLNPGLPSLDL